MLLKQGDKIGLVECSNIHSRDFDDKLNELKLTLDKLGLEAVFSGLMRKKSSEPQYIDYGRERGAAVMEFYEDSGIKAIFDVSGGDSANSVLDYLDYDVIRQNPKPFFGYSDLTTVLNAIFAKTGLGGGLYQLMNLVYGDKSEHLRWFFNTFMGGKNDLLDIKCSFLQGSKLEGISIGGNMRCFLKLAGTPYMPAFRNKVLVLESLSGTEVTMTAAINQYRHMGAFRQIGGILIGTFTNMEKEKNSPAIEEIIIKAVNDKSLPIAKTDEIGHQSSSRCVMIGKPIVLGKRQLC